MSEWQPQQQGLRELLFLLGEAANPNSRDQGLINQVNNCIFYNEIYRKKNLNLKKKPSKSVFYHSMNIQIIIHI